MSVLLRVLGLEHLELRKTFNKSLTWSIMLIAVSQFNFGFEQQGFNTTQAMNQFARVFGVWDEAKGRYELETWWLSLFTGLPYIGFGLGIIIGSMVSKRYGRRMCMFTMSIWSLITTVIIITARKRDQILAGRILEYIYIGMELAVVPIYQAEITPKEARGFVVGTYQLSLAIGGLVVNGVARGTGDIPGEASFRIVYGLFFIIPTIVAAGVWFIPESPRWYASQDRHEEALTALTRLRQGKFSREQIAEEMHYIRSGIEREVEQGKFTDMFHDLQTTKRTMVVVGVNFFLQSTGSLFASVYGAYFIRSLNIINPFTVTVSNSAVQLVACVIAMVMVDKLGRRNIIFFGCSIQTIGLFVMGGLGTVADPSTSVRAGVIIGMCVMVFGFTTGWAPTSHTLSAEIPSMRLRDITYRSASIVNILTQFAVTISMPYLLNEPYAALGSRVGFIFGSVALLSMVFVYLCLPECKGRSLEEIDLLFESKVPLRKFAGVKLEETALLNPVGHVAVQEPDAKGGSVQVERV